MNLTVFGINNLFHAIKIPVTIFMSLVTVFTHIHFFLQLAKRL